MSDVNSYPNLFQYSIICLTHPRGCQFSSNSCQSTHPAGCRFSSISAHVNQVIPQDVDSHLNSSPKWSNAAQLNSSGSYQYHFSMASPNGVMSAMSIQPVNNAARQASTQLTCYWFLATARYTVSSYRLFATRIQSLFRYRLPCTWDTLSLYLDFSPCEVVHSLCQWVYTVLVLLQYGLRRYPALALLNLSFHDTQR